MAEEIFPTGQKIYDPLLGKERDAFPEEVVPPDQEKTLQRLMREGEEKFKSLFDAVAGTGKLGPDELNAILKAGKINAELERQKYLEAIRTNPANILVDILKKLDPERNGDIAQTLSTLNERITEITSRVEAEKNRALLAQKPLRSTKEYVNAVTSGFNQDVLINYQAPDFRTTADFEGKAVQIVSGCDAFPTPRAVTFRELVNLLPRFTSQERIQDAQDSGKPFFEGGMMREGFIRNLSAKRSGLEGIFLDIRFSQFNNFDSLIIRSNRDAWARIIDKGNYVPYEPFPQSGRRPRLGLRPAR